MSNETIADLRSHLFDTLKGLADKDKPMDIERARAVAEVAQTIINSAKVEVDHLKIVGGKGSGFIPLAAPTSPVGKGVVGQGPGFTVRQHRLDD